METAGLVERDEALAAFLPVLAAARAGSPSALFVIGDAGLGKSAVLHEAVRAATGFEVLGARGERADVSLPYGYLSQALSEAGMADLLASASDLPAEERPAAARTRLRRWLEAPRDVPVLFALDDLHWADPDSLTLVRLMVRHVRAVPVAVVATMRSWPAPAAELAAGLAQDGVAGLVRLAPLSPTGASGLAARITGRRPDAGLQAQVSEWCAGNPLLIHQLAERLDGDNRLTAPAGADGGARLLLGRFTGLDAAGLDFARAAAVCGVQFSPSVAGALAGLDDAQTTAALADLCGAGLLQDAGGHGGASFSHALVRQALYDDLAAPLRAQLHAAAFRLLWDGGAPAGEAASHALAANLVGDPAAVTATQRAGADALACGALDSAKGWVSGALRLAGSRAEAGVRLRLAGALHACGAAAPAAQVCRELLGEAEAGGAWVAETHRLLGRTLFDLGETVRAEESLRQAAACALPTDRRLAIEALLEGSLLGLYTSGPRRSLEFARDAHRLLDDHTDPELAAWVITSRGHARMLMADPGGAVDVETGLAMLPGGSGLRGWRGSIVWGPRLVALQTAKITERFDEGLACFEATMSEVDPALAPVVWSVYAVAHADILSRLGRLAEARELLSRAAQDTPWLVAGIPWALLGLAHVHFELDDPVAAEGCSTQIEAIIGAEGETLPLLRLWLWRVQAALALQRHDTDAACRLMDRARDGVERSGTYEPTTVPWHPVAIAAYVHAGRLEDAQTVIDSLEATFAASRNRWPRAIAARGRALLAERAGDRAGAQAHFADALAWHQPLPMPLEHAETLLAYGSFLRRAGTPARARELLGQAAQLATACGASRLARLTIDELHTAGGRRPKRAPGQLTPIEQRVANLAASGLTNTDIATQLTISPRTVEHHLTRVYATLGITSRRSLRQALETNPDRYPTQLDAEVPAPQPGVITLLVKEDETVVQGTPIARIAAAPAR